MATEKAEAPMVFSYTTSPAYHIIAENTDRYARFDPIQFAFSLLTRSKRITYENLKVRDPDFARAVDAWFAGQSKSWGEVRKGEHLRPRETPYLLRSVALAGRIAGAIPPGFRAAGQPGPRHRWVPTLDTIVTFNQ